LPRQRLLHLLWSKVTELRRLSAHQHCRQFRTQGMDKGCADVILYCSTAVSKIDSILPLHREDQPYLLAELEAEVLEIRQLDRAVVMTDLQKHSVACSSAYLNICSFWNAVHTPTTLPARTFTKQIESSRVVQKTRSRNHPYFDRHERMCKWSVFHVTTIAWFLQRS